MKSIFLFLAMSFLGLSPDGKNLQTADGQPIFLLGTSAGDLLERLPREDTDRFLDFCSDEGYNLVRVEAASDVPSINVYGQRSGTHEYWYHLDYVVQKAENNGIYVAIECIDGKAVSEGKMNVELAGAYGKFLGTRYKDKPNVIWIAGPGEGEWSEVWTALSESLQAADGNHPVLLSSGEDLPSVADKDDVTLRSLAYCSVFEGARSYTLPIDVLESFNASKTAPIFSQMKYLRNLMTVFNSPLDVDAREMTTDGYASCGSDYLLVYSSSDASFSVDASMVSGTRRHAWWYSPVDGSLQYIGETKENTVTFSHRGKSFGSPDAVLVLVDWKSSEKIRALKRMNKEQSIVNSR